MPSALFAASIVLFTLFYLLATRRRRNSPNLPPGPPADPLIGHLRMIPTTNQAMKFQEWTQIYGDVIYLKVFSRNIIVLGSAQVAQDLLDTRSSKYSCRPALTIFEIMGWNPTLVFMQYGKSFVKHRRIFQQYFSRSQSLTFQPVFAEEARYLVKNLLTPQSDQRLHMVKRFTTSNIMRIAFGHRVESDEDPFMKIGNDISTAVNNCGPAGNTPVDFFPWLKHFPSWFPGTYYGNIARSHFKIVRRLHDDTVEFVKANMRDGTVERCFASDKLGELGEVNNLEDVEDIKGASATIFAAGQDTTDGTLTVFYLMMLLHPEYQKRAYDEIVSAIGHNRIPVYSDRESLPYLDCIVQETIRWHPTAQLGVPHRSLEDDVYKDMFISKGSIIVTNLHGMGRDKNIYSDPDRFDPSRYLPEPQGKGEPPFSAGFGFGRRKCPGQYFADLSLWNAMACTLATLEIVPAKDQNGDDIIPPVAFTEGIVSRTEFFPFHVRPRSEAAGALLNEIEK